MLTDLILVIVIATSVWVAFDARSIGVRKGKIEGFFNMGAAGWFFSCLLLWVVAFPAYLVKRGAYRAANAPVSPASGSPMDQIEALARLRERGAISEEEFQAKKQELLLRI